MDKLQAKIAEIVQQELGQLAQLEVVLGQEHEALKKRDNDALASSTAEKNQLVTALERRGSERIELLKAAGLGADQEAIHAFVETEPQLQALWQQLETALLNCQKQNQVNGMLLEKGRQQAQHLLGILLGENKQHTETYDAKGGTSSSFTNGRSVKV